jgi:hypothetical protein
MPPAMTDPPSSCAHPPTSPGSPAITAATLAALLARHGVTRIYTAAGRNIAVVSVGSDLTAWTDGRQLWCIREGHRETWPVADTGAAAARLAALAVARPAAPNPAPAPPGEPR